MEVVTVAIEAKMSFMGQLEKHLGDKVLFSEMSGIMSAVADVLQGFEMQEISFRNEEPDDLLGCYISALKIQGRSQKTLDRYQYVITKMVEFTGVQTRQVTVYHLREYLAKEKNRGICDTTLENERQIFCGYFNWLQRESLINRNPTANLGAIKCAKKKKLAYSETDLDKLHQVACHETRDRAIISFLESTGCRISEALELNRDDVDLERQKCIVHGKGNKERTVYLNDVTTMVLKQYLEERKDQNEALFVSLRGDHERLQPGGVRIMLKRIGKKAGVENVHPRG